ncbi:hypothetical protein HB13667_01235 [Pseudomonas putida]|jgi:predicted ATPase/DNA-binding winged helix-turn-helix (wHTH) protein|nr:MULTISPECIES: winged helix-turn-helix domain-containing protein [Pseudomonas]KPM68656.1 hypothetical protein HB13667_01235 [Pseudomonas putida]MCS7747805.1 winged helix-turn-helix domain-containing protein [Pseudomonas aeruginosa]MCS8000844.1 winged helix-turn-helix domain-containing protein [Pseudomonas aeruginosa]MCS9648538.1 winged helix-turn-helix domain-containing protein [Pseudomonas aeruginosa]
MGGKVIRFGGCELLPVQRQLSVHGQPVGLSGRAFELLLRLAEADGAVVSKDELMAAAWPGRIVEENTLEAQISLLRKALGNQRGALRTVSGRGYQLLMPAASDTLDVPLGVSSLVGRETALDELLACVRRQRLVTLVGPGGIGKTRLALECARRLAEAFPDLVCLADLTPLSSAEYVASTVAEALGLRPMGGGAPLARIAPVLGARRILLVLDNCEHLIDAAALAVVTLLHACPGVQVLATSREPLRVEDEYVYRVAPLEVPEPGASPEELGQASAVRLLEARLEHGGGTPMEPTDVALMSSICRRLDGIPLAIELAAARAAALGLVAVAERLDQRLDLLSGGSRLAAPRHQTLVATLDWSFDLLSAREQDVFRRLGVFAGAFSLEGAVAVGGAGLSTEGVLDCLASLVAKSLLVVAGSRDVVRYRLLETTRAYARSRLEGAAQLHHCRNLHAHYLLASFSAAEAHWELGDTETCGRCDELLEDLRQALAWAFSAPGDTALGIDLTVAALPFWMRRSLVGECLASATTALEKLATPDLFERKVMKLEAVRGKAQLYVGAAVETREAFGRCLQIARRLGDADYQSRALWGLWAHGYLNGPYDRNRAIAAEFSQLARDNPGLGDTLVAQRMEAMSQLCLGNLPGAERGLCDMLARYDDCAARRHAIRYAYDQKAVALCALAYLNWLRGRPERALDLLRQAECQAEASGHLASQWHVLTMSACPLGLLTGGVAGLQHAGRALLDARTWQPSDITGGAGQFWGGEFWHGLYRLWQGEEGAYETVIVPALAQLGEVRFASYLAPYTSALCELLAERGRLPEALRLIEEAVNHATRQFDLCSLPELTRCQGELLLRAAEGHWSGAGEGLLGEALLQARQAGMLGWELRAVTSLARLWMRQGKHTRAARELGEVLAGFDEGFDTQDLRTARELLAALVRG